MSLFFKTDQKIALMQKTQESLEAIQKNLEIIASQGQFVPVPELSEDMKRQAAYALNFCMVSVSQIVDYNDVYILEQEYEAILNNLNLETMPKDEALLDILKQLLNTITFFRIQEVEKRLLEEEYQHNMRNAIWNAVPNLSAIITVGSPIAMLGSLATQVGIGYMNYRKTKAENSWQYTKQMRKLEEVAMEQFHCLRRDLFDTAWRLADKYKFKDEYRLTERQITQFNEILLDIDDARRYERLEYIQNYFEAYPPFWYYLGHAANAVYHDVSYEEDIRLYYKAKAISNFNKFRETAQFNILREDQIAASCALEYFDLVDSIEEKRELLKLAKKHSGNAFDVLQMCAMMYLGIGDLNEAVSIFKMLVNENYNQKVNAQLLSQIYVAQIVDDGNQSRRNDYALLAKRVGSSKVLFPMPPNETKAMLPTLQASFLSSQREQLIQGYQFAINQYILKNKVQYKLLRSNSGDITEEIVKFIRVLCEEIEYMFSNKQVAEETKRIFTREISKVLESNQKSFREMLQYKANRSGQSGYLSFDWLTVEAFAQLRKKVRVEISKLLTLSEFCQEEVALMNFCRRNGISSTENKVFLLDEAPKDDIMSAIFGENYKENQKIVERQKLCKEVFVRKKDLLIIPSEKDKKAKNEVAIRGEKSFVTYIERNRDLINYMPENSTHILSTWDDVFAIINDRTITDRDLIFTTTGIVATSRGFDTFGFKLVDGVAIYQNIGMLGNDKLQIGNSKYSGNSVNMSVLYEIVEGLKGVARNNPL